MKAETETTKILAQLNGEEGENFKFETARLFSKGDNRTVDEVFKMYNNNKITNGTVTQLAKNKKLVFVKEKQDARIKTIDEARGIITADYQQALEDEWVKSLKKKYKVKVNEKVLSSIIKE